MILMIPGPIEVSPAVVEAFGGRPPSHLAPEFIEAHGRALQRMREVWLAGPDAQPFAVPGSGTIAMEMAVANLVARGDDVLVANTGYFSDRIALMAKRRGATVKQVRAAPGDIPGDDEIEAAAVEFRPSTIFATHVDTSTGVRVDPQPICDVAQEIGALTVFDGVCATAAERFEMNALRADVYLTASQKAIGLPPGLALIVSSPAAMERRARLGDDVPLALDWEQWLPIMQSYEDRRPSYFSTPVTSHIAALDVSLGELLDDGIDAVFDRHERVATGMRNAWKALGLELLSDPNCTANSLSAVRYPEGSGPQMLARVSQEGVAIAGGLYPGLKQSYFRVGHMGYSTTRHDQLETTVRAIATAIGGNVDTAVEALDSALTVP